MYKTKATKLPTKKKDIYVYPFPAATVLLRSLFVYQNLCGEFCGTCSFEIRIVSPPYIHTIIASRRRLSMMHTPRLSNIKRASVLLVAALLLYVFVLSSGYQKYQIEGIIKRSQPEKVWEYVADFNKMRLLNPTM